MNRPLRAAAIYLPLLALLPGCMWVTGVATYFGVKAATDGGSGGSVTKPVPPVAMDPGPFTELEAKPQTVWTGDFLPDPDGRADGIADVAVVYENSGRVAVYRGDGRGILREEPTLGINLGASPTLASAVLPSAGAGGTDGLLAATSRTLELVRWTGPNGSPEAIGTRLSALDDEGRDIAVGDFDGNGGRDVAVSSLANGTIEFFAAHEGPGDLVGIEGRIDGIKPLSICAADFVDDDGIDDLVVLSQSGNFGELSLYQSGSSGTPATLLESVGLSATATYLARPAADMNADGWPDVAYIRGDGTGSAFVRPPDDDHPSWFDVKGRGGAHLSPSPKGLVLLQLPGGAEGAVDRVTVDEQLGALVVSYFKRPTDGHDIDSTVSYPLPGAGTGLSAGDLDGDGSDDLLAIARGPGGYFLVPCLANPSSAVGEGEPGYYEVRDEPFRYVRGSFLGSQHESAPSLMDIGFGHAGPGEERPFLAAVDRVNSEVVVVLLDSGTEAPVVVSKERIRTIAKSPAGILVRDFDLDLVDDIVVIGSEGFDLLRCSGAPAPEPAFDEVKIENASFLDLLRLDPRFRPRVTPAVSKEEEAAFLAGEFPGWKLREHAAAVNLDLHLAPDLAIPLATNPGTAGRDHDYVVVVRNPAFPESPSYQAQFVRTVFDPRQVNVANLNDDGALDLVVAGKDSEQVGLVFGDPSSPGSFVDRDDAPLHPVSLPGLKDKVAKGVYEVQTAASRRWDAWAPPPFVSPPVAEWLLVSTAASVVRYCRSGKEEVEGGWIPRFDLDPADVYQGQDPEAVYIDTLFPDGKGFDFVVTDEERGRVLLFADRGSKPGACRSWELASDLAISSPQHFASVTLGEKSYLAVASRAAQEIQLYLRNHPCPSDERCFRLESRIPLPSPLHRPPRGAVALGLGDDGTPALVLGVAEDDLSDGAFEVDVAFLGRSADDLTDLGAPSSQPSHARVKLEIEGIQSALHLADLDSDGVSDLLTAEPQAGSPTWKLKVYRGRNVGTEGPIFEPAGTAVLDLGEDLRDYCVVDETSTDLQILAAGNGGVKLVRISKAPPSGIESFDFAAEAVLEWISGSVEDPLRVAWGLRERRSREPAPFVAIIGKSDGKSVLEVDCPQGEATVTCRLPVGAAWTELSALGVRDLDDDGDDDVVVVDEGTAKLRVYRSEGGRANPTFSGVDQEGKVRKAGEVEEGYPLGVPSRAVDVGFLDSNHDGMIDVAVGFETGEVLVFRGKGDGFMVEPAKLRAGSDLWALRTCDLDRDGREETILAACTMPGLVILAARPDASPAAATPR